MRNGASGAEWTPHFAFLISAIMDRDEPFADVLSPAGCEILPLPFARLRLYCGPDLRLTRNGATLRGTCTMKGETAHGSSTER